MKYNDDNVKEMILDNTKDLLNTKGVKGWSMDELAANSSLAKNTLYKIIGSKKNAVISVLLRDVSNLQEKIIQFEKENTDHLDMDDMVEFFAKSFAQIHGPYIQEIQLEYPGSKPGIREKVDGFKQIVERSIHRLQKEEKIRNDVDPEAVFLCFRGITTEHIRLGHTGDIFMKEAAVAFKYVLYGIAVR